MPTNDLVLDALGDNTRRDVLEQLRDGPLTVGQIAERLPVSRPAVSKHLKILLEAELVTVEQVGTRRVHALDLAGLARLRTWLDGFWDTALDAFEAQLTTSGSAAADPQHDRNAT